MNAIDVKVHSKNFAIAALVACASALVIFRPRLRLILGVSGMEYRMGPMPVLNRSPMVVFSFREQV